jgi:hypothetical protein
MPGNGPVAVRSSALLTLLLGCWYEMERRMGLGPVFAIEAKFLEIADFVEGQFGSQAGVAHSTPVGDTV